MTLEKVFYIHSALAVTRGTVFWVHKDVYFRTVSAAKKKDAVTWFSSKNMVLVAFSAYNICEVKILFLVLNIIMFSIFIASLAQLSKID